MFRIDTEYYTFFSGALISIPLTLLFETAENYKEIAFWIALSLSMLSSFLCFKLSIILKEVNEIYTSNKDGAGDIATAWNSAISEQKASCITYLSLTIATLILALVCVFLMQFIDTSATPIVAGSVLQVASSIH